MTKNDINQAKLIGGKKKNGHKPDCECHICQNMKNKAERGGYQEEQEKAEEQKMGGSKKKNGHRANCKCPICKNMLNSKKGGKKGGSRYEEKEGTTTDKKESGSDSKDQSTDSEDEETESDSEDEDQPGGRNKKKGNGHKANCKCPICKNMRKSKKGGDGISDLNSDMKENETEASDEDYNENKIISGGTRKRRHYKKRGGKTRKNKRRNTHRTR